MGRKAIRKSLKVSFVYKNGEKNVQNVSSLLKDIELFPSKKEIFFFKRMRVKRAQIYTGIAPSAYLQNKWILVVDGGYY